MPSEVGVFGPPLRLFVLDNARGINARARVLLGIAAEERKQRVPLRYPLTAGWREPRQQRARDRHGDRLGSPCVPPSTYVRIQSN